jgi:hypothetical protein
MTPSRFAISEPLAKRVQAETLREEEMGPRLRRSCQKLGGLQMIQHLMPAVDSCDDFVGVGGLGHAVCPGDESVDGGPEIDNGSEDSNTSLARAGLSAHGRCEIVLGTINILAWCTAVASAIRADG